MTTQITLTDKQRGLLYTAGTLFSGDVLQAAASVRLYGGAYEMVTEKLISSGLLEEADGQMKMTGPAYALAGIEQNPGAGMENAETPEPALEAAPTENQEPETATDAAAAPSPETPKTKKMRDGTKQAQIIEMLKRPEGATLTQIVECTGWKIHTARAVLSRTIQKDLGIPLNSEKRTGEERVYRVNA